MRKSYFEAFRENLVLRKIRTTWYYTAKMTEPLVTRNIQYNFTFLLSFLASFKDMICSFINLTTYCNMAIHCNTLKDNMQYGIDPYCYIPRSY